jgi:two-component system LytT family response regulator
MKAIRTLLVDDEIGALSALKSIIEAESPELEIIGTARSVDEAYQLSRSLLPELIFLDIQLRDQSGFDLLEKNFEHHFEVIFVTAYDQYAIEAFKKNALSYLLKPVSFDELSRVKERALKILSSSLNQTSNYGSIKLPPPARIAIPDTSGIEYFRHDEVIYVKADGSYCTLVLKDHRKKTLSRPLRYIEDKIPQELFVRVHRSYLVNTQYILKWEKSDGGSLVLSDQSIIPISRSGRKLLSRILE